MLLRLTPLLGGGGDWIDEAAIVRQPSPGVSTVGYSDKKGSFPKSSYITRYKHCHFFRKTWRCLLPSVACASFSCESFYLPITRQKRVFCHVYVSVYAYVPIW